MYSFINQTQKPKYIVDEWLSTCPVESDDVLINSFLFPIAETYNELESTLNDYFQFDGVPGLKVVEDSISKNAFVELDIVDKTLKERNAVLTRVFESIQESTLKESDELTKQLSAYHSEMMKNVRMHLENAKEELINEMIEGGK